MESITRTVPTVCQYQCLALPDVDNWRQLPAPPGRVASVPSAQCRAAKRYLPKDMLNKLTAQKVSTLTGGAAEESENRSLLVIVKPRVFPRCVGSVVVLQHLLGLVCTTGNPPILPAAWDLCAGRPQIGTLMMGVVRYDPEVGPYSIGQLLGPYRYSHSLVRPEGRGPPPF